MYCCDNTPSQMNELMCDVKRISSLIETNKEELSAFCKENPMVAYDFAKGYYDLSSMIFQIAGISKKEI